MQLHSVRVHPEAARLPRQDQLAYKLTRVAANPVPVEAEVADMIVNRVIVNHMSIDLQIVVDNPHLVVHIMIVVMHHEVGGRLWRNHRLKYTE